MAQEANGQAVPAAKNVVKVNVLRANVKQTKVVDTDIVFVLEDGRTVFIRDGAVQSLLDNGFSVEFSDGGQVTGQELLQSAGAAEISSVALSGPQASSDNGVIVAQAPQADGTSPVAQPSSGGGLRTWLAVGTPLVGGVLGGVLGGGGGGAAATATDGQSNLSVKPATPVINVVANDDKVNLAEKGATNGVAVSGIAEASASVTVNWGSTSKTVTADSAGRWSASFSSTEVPADAAGTTISATVKSSAGVSSDPATRTVQIDTTPPAAPTIAAVTGDGVISPTEKASQAGVDVNGTAEAGSTVTVSFGGISKSVVADAGGNWSVNYKSSEVPNPAEYSVTATARDANGNLSTAPATSTVRVTPAIDVSGQIVAGPVQPGNGLSVEIYRANGTLLVAGVRVNADGSFTARELPIGAGDVIFAKVVDSTTGADYRDEATGAEKDLNAVLLAVKAVSGTSVTMNINPLTTIAAIKAGLAADGSGTIASAAVATNANTATAQAFGLSGIDISTTSVVATNSGGFTPSDGLSSGEKVGAVLAALSGMDSINGGNSQTTLSSISQRITIEGSAGKLSDQGQVDLMQGAIAAEDKVEGVLQSIISDGIAAATATTQVNINAIATDNVITAGEVSNLTISGTVSAGVTGVSVLLGSRTATATVTGSAWSYALTPADIEALGADGAKVIQVQAALPNSAPASASRVVTLKVAPPPAPSLDVISGDNAINSSEKTAGVTFSGTGEVGSTVVLTFGSVTKNAPVGTIGTSAGIWTTSFSASEIPADGTSTVTVLAQDVFGNSSSSVSRSIRIDTIAPGLPIIRAVAGDDLIGPIEKQAGVQIVGTADALANIRLTFGNLVRTATADGSGNWSVSLLSSQVPTDGEYALTVTQSDTTGNASPEATRTVRVDAQPPAKPIILPVATDNIVNAAEKLNGVTIRGTAEPNVNIELTWGTISRVIKAAANGTWSASFTGAQVPADGSASVTATATDSSGNISEPAIRPVTIDTLSQDLTIASVATDDVINAAEKAVNVTVTGQAEPGANVVVTLGGNSRNALANQLGAWVVNFPTAEIPADTNLTTVTAVSTDQAGNNNGAAVGRNIRIDTGIPNKPVINIVAEDDAINADEATSTVEVTGTAEALSLVTVTWGTATRTANADADGNWKATFAATQIPPEGATVVTATARDSALNFSNAEERPVLIDIGTSRPVISAIAGDDIINATERTNGVVVSGTAEADATVRLVWGTVIKTPKADADGNWSQLFIAAEIPLSGNGTITATPTDKYGNVGTAAQPKNFTIDTSVSPAQFNDVAGSNNIVKASEKSQGVQVSGTAEVGSGIQVTWGARTKPATADASGAWAVFFAESEIPGDGSAPIRAVVTDLAGNVSVQSDKPVTIDTVAPVAPVVTLPIAGDNVINASERITGVVVAGTAEANADVTIAWGTTSSQTIKADGVGEWSATFTGAQINAVGSETINVSQTDVAGNSGPATPVTVIVNTGLPAAPFINAVGTNNIVNSAEKDAGVTISGTSLGLSDVTVTWGITKTVKAALNGNWSVTFASAEVPADGSRPVTAFQTDTLGNISPTTTPRNITVDTVPLPVPVITTPITADNVINATEKGAAVNISGTTTSGNTAVEVKWGGGPAKTVTSNSTTRIWTATFASSEVPADGTGTLIEARTIDSAGNPSAWVSHLVGIDTTRPATPVINTVAGDNVINASERQGSITVSGTAENNASVLVTWNGYSKPLTANNLGIWSTSFASTELPTDGSSNIVARATDAAGNTNAVDAQRSITTVTSGVPLPVINLVSDDDRININERTAGITVTGTALANAAVSVTFGTTTKPVAAGSDGIWSASFAVGEIAPEGAVRPITAVQTDSLGNSSGTATRNVEVDLTPASNLVISQTGGVDGVVNAAEKSAGVTVSGTSSDAASVEVLWGSVTKSGSVTGGVWSAAFSATEVPADAVTSTIRVTMIDASGNRSVERTSPVGIDTTRPATPVINTVAGDNVINASERQGSITVSGTAENNASVLVTWNGYSKPLTANNLGIWSTSFASTELPTDGSSNIVARATDAAGNTNAVDAQRSITTVTSGVPLPVINLVSDDDRININERTAGITVTGTALANAAVSVTFGTTTKPVAAGSDGIWSASFAVGEIAPEGAVRPITAVQTDSLGNSSGTATRNVEVDLTRPVNLAFNATAGNNIVNATEKGASVVVSGTTDAGNAVTVTWGGVSKNVTSTNGSWSVLYASNEVPADNVASTISAIARDPSGNDAASPVNQTVRIDTALPAAPVINTVATDNKVSATEASGVIVSGTAEVGATVTLTWGNTAARTLTAADGTWSTTYSNANALTALPLDGLVPVIATQTDSAGNTSVQASLSVEVDTTPPPVPIITGMSNDYGIYGDFTTDRNAVVVTGGGTPNGRVELFQGAQSLGFFNVDAAGFWQSPTISLASLADGGTVTVSARAYDPAGNASTTAASQVITKAAGTNVGTTTIDLGLVTNAAGSLNSGLGFSFAGAAADDRITSFTTGDVGGDSRRDLIFNSHLVDDGVVANVGGVAVVFGRANWNDLGTFDLANLGSNGWLLRGNELGGQLGHGGSSVIGDLNGDGKGELIAGEISADNGTIVDAGAAYIVWGSTTPLGDLETNGGITRYVLKTTQVTQDKGFVFRGLTTTENIGNATLGISSTPGNQDFNGDGRPDFFIAARNYDRPLVTAGGSTVQTLGTDVGGVMVVFGQAPGSAYGTLNSITGQQEMTINNLTGLDKGFIIRGGAASDQAGFSIASAGDVNGDGVTDLLIGAMGVNRGAFSTAGAAYVVYGKITQGGLQTWAGMIDDPEMPGRKILDLGTLRTEDGFMIWGEAQDGTFGRSVEGVGDVNGDGFDDIVVGATTVTVGGVTNAGSAYVILGSGSGQATAAVSPNGRQILDVSVMTPSQGFIIRGVAAAETVNNPQLGRAVGAAGDVNGDGLADIMVVAPYLDRTAALTDAGRAYIILGKDVGEEWGQRVGGVSTLDLAQLNSADGFSLIGRASSDVAGEAPGDTSIISPGDLNGDGLDDLFINPPSADIYGRNNNGEGVFVYGSSGLGGMTVNGSNADNVLNGGGFGDTINGLGGADRLRGFAGNDTLIIGDAGFVRVDGGTDTDTLRLAGATGFGLNLSTLAPGAIKDIEQIDLFAGSLNNTLTITQQTLLDLSTTSDRLTVLGDGGDTVNAAGFTLQTGSQTLDGVTYNTYTNGTAQLWVQQGVQVVLGP